ncbi:DUF3826 domain-containing protein [Dyadobacter tibetensis]|uniref:DUF3826 domain-containing protein n=1 Tax=Dyadobacter tibetensis TaxID=1211851 RepID=UPI0004727FE6|nr:DUF3826 domain-containing protein [Dyadobacter tibetensis]
MNKIAKILMILMGAVVASTAQIPADRDVIPEATLLKRVDKILAPMQISDSVKYLHVRKVVVNQYQILNDLQRLRFEEQDRLKQRKADTPLAVSDLPIIPKADSLLRQAHVRFLDKLGQMLTEQEIISIKNGMTYGVLPVTYDAYQKMIPSLSAGEKMQILDWLTEAREIAMDASSSDAKHQVFGKYKGRINNYLSARGYDLQAERKAWEERQKK